MAFGRAHFFLDLMGVRVPLYDACKEGDVENVLLALDKDPLDLVDEREDRTPLQIACEKGHVEVVRVLLRDPRVDINRRNRVLSSALHLACQANQADVVGLLVSDGRLNASLLNGDGVTARELAQVSGYSSISHSLPPDTDLPHEYHISRLRRAVQANDVDLVARLLCEGKGGDINEVCVEEGSITVLHLATSKRNREIVSALVKEKGTDANLVDADGNTALHIAASLGETTIVSDLIYAPGIADPFKPDANGHTAMYLAATHGHPSTVEDMIWSGRFDNAYLLKEIDNLLGDGAIKSDSQREALDMMKRYTAVDKEDK